MKRLPLAAVLLLAACEQPGVQRAPLRLDKAWVSGEVAATRRRDGTTEVNVHLRLGDPEAFAREFPIHPPYALECQQVRLLYRKTPQSDQRILTTQWSHTGVLYPSEPLVCLQRGIESEWRVLIAGERGELPLDLNGRVVLISGEEPGPREEIALEVLDSDVPPSTAARSEWVPLRRR